MKNRIARQLCLVAAIVGFPSFSAALAQAPARQPGARHSSRPDLTSAQLADLVAPLALYPDALLSQTLVASTYPLEVVQAQQWLRRNEGLRGQELMDAARTQPWDASVQGLVAFPDALATLNEDIQWTTALGNAFLAQETDVMSAVQRLRAKAQAAGRLSSNPQQTVSAVAQEGGTVIEIVPADPQVIYVPQYDPVYVWGAPAWSSYPSLSYGYGYGFGLGIDVGYWFGGWAWGRGWGWGPNWYGGSVYVNSAFFRHCGYNYGRHRPYYGGPHGGHNGGYNGGHNGGNHGGNARGGQGGRETWQHDAGHRMGVAYSNRQLAGKYEAISRASRSGMSTRGSWDRSGDATASPSGSRSLRAGSMGRGTEQVWRSGNRAAAPESRDRGSDQAGRAGTRAMAPSAGRGAADQGWRAGNRAEAPGSRGGGMEQSWRSGGRSAPDSRPGASDQAWRSGRRADVSGPRSGGADRGWSSSGELSRRSQGEAPRQGSTMRDPGSIRRYPASPSRFGESSPSPRSAAPSSSYSAPSRSYSSSAPARGFQAAPRSSSSDGGGRSFGGGGSRSSGNGGSSRGAGGGSGSTGGSRGGGRHR
jgi:hypothetical protein